MSKTFVGIEDYSATGKTVQSIPYPTYTSSERDALTVPEGYKINNSDTGKIETLINGVWSSVDFDECFVLAMSIVF